MSLNVILFSVCWFLLCMYKLKFNLHMLQIEGYKNEKYLEWIKNHKEKIYSQKDKVFTAFLVATAIVFMLSLRNGAEDLDYFEMLGSTATAVYLIITTRKKYESKKPLVLTKRAKRLMFIALLLLVVDYTIVVGLTHIVTKDVIKYFPLWAGILAVVYLLCSYYILGANIIAKPIERKINKGFYDQASHKIKNMNNLTSIGITGSYGKTSTKFAAAAILKEKFNVLHTPESYNTPMGISKIINNKLTNEYEVFISELGATKVGDIDEVAALTNPKIGILTSIGPCHLETFKSIDNIMRTKYELIERLPDDGVAIFNYDNEYVKKLADKTFKEKLLYGIKNIENTDVFATDIKVDSTGSKFTLCINGLGTINCETKLLGEHNILNLLAGAAAARVLGMSLQEIARGISKVESVEHRLQLIDPGTGVIVIDDAFNSNPDGAKAALDVLDSFEGKRKIIVTPGMIELGELEEVENEILGEHIARVCDIAILVGKKKTEPIYRGLKKHQFVEENLYVVNSLAEATKVLETLTRVNDVVLFENDLPDTYNEH